ncbi:subtilisin-like protease [Typha latifolia]|uniref:subtilisin-like protease n=1 Tax=Typha latifolia TaxID=4733 RepID=UPI003C30579C
MESQKMISFFSLHLPFVLLFSAFSLVLSSNKLESYIVQLQPPANADFALDEDVKVWHESFLPEATSGESRLIHSYTEVFSGFAARLTEDELANISNKPGFVRSYPDRVLQLLTTHTPQFLGLTPGNGLWNSSNYGEGVIIGLLDTGITPTHPSFSDEGMPPPPKKWRGSCAFEKGCNNKLIGAKSLVERSQKAPFDGVGHGTHTSSTAAGNFVADAEAFGLAGGMAVGIAPRAHVAMYRVCNVTGCSGATILAGMDAAVKDGVDVLSLSLGGPSLPFSHDIVAIGAFGAMQKGVVVSCAAGNGGPAPSSLSNEAPWILTVAASSIDRSFRSTVKLGDGREFHGEALNQTEDNSTSESFSLAYSPEFSLCNDFTNFPIKGKIVVCEGSVLLSLHDIAAAVIRGGGVGMITINPPDNGFTTNDKALGLPASQLPSIYDLNITTYGSSKDPTASFVFNGTVLGVSPAPVVAYFSSRGPNKASPGILKPDISAPGLNVLAAWPAQVGSGNSGVKTFNIISGTSMATPHISGIAALLKSLHPNWSPAAIKSAIMTTSDTRGRNGMHVLDEQFGKAPFYTMGAGHVNPTKAADPGLVYDIGLDDYIGYICNLYGDTGLFAIVRSHNASCSKVANITEAQLNYPAIVVAPAGKPVTVKRTVTNVGKANSSYKVELDVPEEVSVIVTPPELQFSKVNEKMTFTVRVSWKGSRKGSVDGNLRWVSAEHVVRSPIVIVDGSSA